MADEPIDNSTAKVRVEARLDSDTVVAAKELAYQQRRSLNQLLQEAVDAYLDSVPGL